MSEFSTEAAKTYKAILESFERSRALTSFNTISKMSCEVTNHRVEQFTKYDTTYTRTMLTFADGSKESVECPADKADAYYGFTTCYAKHIAKKFLNKNISDIADYWLITKPKREAEARVRLMLREQRNRDLQSVIRRDVKSIEFVWKQSDARKLMRHLNLPKKSMECQLIGLKSKF